jgi:hypothetical protein
MSYICTLGILEESEHEMPTFDLVTYVVCKLDKFQKCRKHPVLTCQMTPFKTSCSHLDLITRFHTPKSICSKCRHNKAPLSSLASPRWAGRAISRGNLICKPLWPVLCVACKSLLAEFGGSQTILGHVVVQTPYLAEYETGWTTPKPWEHLTIPLAEYGGGLSF